ncbi:LysR family transcriptional regulator [Phytopseudomonas dryadis]|uniref:LysR family transcriptional regulator n=1 Tax=Phytopseudomonas dryadis TaxID=2487520 RepID=A0A4Q9QN95_9GAMM|nr:LysR family transcriptional regulator [Pseudomonas dryadis]TBU81440.1 LysR family transcriptional regulator [Pseudomonas dryadis]
MGMLKGSDRRLASVTSDWGAIQTFVAVAEAGSLAAGGKALGMTRSAASKAVARLEAHLGVRLLHRTTRRLALSAEGQEFYERCVQILLDLSEAEASVRPDRRAPKGSLRLSVSVSYGHIVILPFLRKLLGTWPQLGVEASFSDRVVDLVEEGFDLGIRFGKLPVDAQLVARPLAKTRPGLYAAPSYLDRQGFPTAVEELGLHERLIYGLRPGPSSWDIAKDDLTGERLVIDGPSRLRFDSGEAIRHAVIAGMGIAYLPSFMMTAEIDAGRLVHLFPDHLGPEIPIHAVYPHRRYLATRVRLFIDELIDHLKES